MHISSSWPVNKFLLPPLTVLRRLGVKGVEIRKAEQLDTVTSLIIPGGESTTMAKLAEFHNLVPPPSLSLSLYICTVLSIYKKRGFGHDFHHENTFAYH